MIKPKSAPATAEASAVATTAQSDAKTPNPAKYPSHRDPQVKGQVAMHAIITGYKVGANLAAALGSTPDKIREELHKLAAEVAKKVEEYTYHE